jgi:hypothetical protein
MDDCTGRTDRHLLLSDDSTDLARRFRPGDAEKYSDGSPSDSSLIIHRHQTSALSEEDVDLHPGKRKRKPYDS